MIQQTKRTENSLSLMYCPDHQKYNSAKDLDEEWTKPKGPPHFDNKFSNCWAMGRKMFLPCKW